ncbi:MAG: hypothetical protein J7M09_07005 [Deltaproteobacteria bacterium]|nr:hypothetical protein [Candidatus Tharpella sp.]
MRFIWPVDFSKVRERIESVINEIQKHDPVERFCQLGVKVEFGHPEFVDEYQARSLNCGKLRQLGKFEL